MTIIARLIATATISVPAAADEQPLRAQAVEVHAHRDPDRGERAEADAADPGVAGECAVQHRAARITATTAISRPVANPTSAYSRRATDEHGVALVTLVRARHRPDRGARHAVADHEQVAGQRGDEAVGAQLGDVVQPPRQQRDDR